MRVTCRTYISSGTASFNTTNEPNGTLWAWGSNDVGELGTGVIGDNGPARVTSIDHVVAYAAGSGHSLAIAHQSG
ncbi:RCC1 domain-containing protein [Mycobacterium sp. E2479]|uniref:RCC1 domain-containing protein n=1 Tax=Mycobacterium sp. E2479 TaxID=1834134 RepID=UPI0009ECFC77